MIAWIMYIIKLCTYVHKNHTSSISRITKYWRIEIIMVRKVQFNIHIYVGHQWPTQAKNGCINDDGLAMQ